MMITLTPKMRWSPWTAPRRTQAGSAAGFIEENVLLKEKKKKREKHQDGRQKANICFCREAFALLSAGGTSESSCQHLQDSACLIIAERWQPDLGSLSCLKAGRGFLLTLC